MFFTSLTVYIEQLEQEEEWWQYEELEQMLSGHISCAIKQVKCMKN